MKTTDWFPGTMKPARPGLYQRMLNVEVVWACFDGSCPARPKTTQFSSTHV